MASLDDMRSDVRAIRGQRDRLLTALGVLFVGTIIGAGFVARRLRNGIHAPLSRLEEAAGIYGDHDFGHRIEMEAEDEFNRVAEAFNSMARRVSSSQAEREKLEAQLRHQALHDSLTGLANRTLFSDRVEHAVIRTKRTDSLVGVVFLDIDDFKGVNDSMGHEAGHELLRGIGKRLQGCIRAGDTAARLGGDEFAVLLDGIASAEDAGIIADRTLEAIGFSFAIGGTEVQVHTSIGIATSEGSDVTGQDLLRRADVAMYSAKGRGKNTAVIYDPGMDLVT